MSAPIAGWLFFRCLRWLLWISTFIYWFEVYIHHSKHVNSFGHLLHSTEFWMFGLPMGAVTAGFMEMMAREKTGFTRPAFLRDWHLDSR